MSTEPKKDIIYVDIEDDITSVIDKVKAAKTTIVALVPPKRIGVLQSVVNLKLLQRAADNAKKRVVLITNDQALTGLAANVNMPVAKNLQSRPEIPAAAAPKDVDDDVINGDELPVGEHAGIKDDMSSAASTLPAAEPGAAAASAPFAAKAAARAPKKGSKLKIPNFDTFRKKLLVFGGLGILLLVFLVWAIFFAGNATVAITAKTNIVNLNKTLQLRAGASLDAGQGVIPAIVKTTKKTSSVDFSATGKREVGERAKGTVQLSTNSISNLGTTVAAGTPLVASNGKTYTTDSSVTFTISNYNNATTGVTAADRGSSFNGASGSMSGTPDGVSATLSGETSGGTDRTITVVSQADVNAASQKLQSEDSNKLKQELKKQFEGTDIIVDESYVVKAGDATSSPAVGQEASGAKLTVETTYTLVGMSRSNLRSVYDADTKSQISGDSNQRIYESGDESTTFTEFKEDDGAYTVRAQATAQVGPNIDDRVLAGQLVGKRSGEIQQQIEGIQGVEDVNVKFSPFWVNKAPNKAEKISINFVLKND